MRKRRKPIKPRRVRRDHRRDLAHAVLQARAPGEAERLAEDVADDLGGQRSHEYKRQRMDNDAILSAGVLWT